MDQAIKESILAIVTMDGSKVQGGGCPVFIASNEEEYERCGLLLSRALGGMVHDLENGTTFIVKH